MHCRWCNTWVSVFKLLVYLCKYFPHSRAFSLIMCADYRVYVHISRRWCCQRCVACIHGRTSGGKYLQRWTIVYLCISPLGGFFTSLMCADYYRVYAQASRQSRAVVASDCAFLAYTGAYQVEIFTKMNYISLHQYHEYVCMCVTFAMLHGTCWCCMNECMQETTKLGPI